jgi:hypothetical protein
VLVYGDILGVLDREASRYKWYQSGLSLFHGCVWSQLRRHGVLGWCGP